VNTKQQRARQREQDKHRKRRAEARREQYNPNDIRWVAAHEAGHAAASAFGMPLEFVDVRRRRLPDGQVSLGFTRTPPLNATDIAGLGEDGILPYLIQIMAGPAAEAQVDRRYALKAGCDVRDRQDTYRAAAIALCGLVKTNDGYEVPRDAKEALVVEGVALCNRAKAEATRFVIAYRAAIEAVAAALIRKTSLTGDEVAALVAAAQV
jgi:hypothetical protein